MPRCCCPSQPHCSTLSSRYGQKDREPIWAGVQGELERERADRCQDQCRGKGVLALASSLSASLFPNQESKTLIGNKLLNYLKLGVFCLWQQLANHLPACIYTHEFPHSCSCNFHPRPAVGREWPGAGCEAGRHMGLTHHKQESLNVSDPTPGKRCTTPCTEDLTPTAIGSQSSCKVSPQLFDARTETWDFAVTCRCLTRLWPRGHNIPISYCL